MLTPCRRCENPLLRAYRLCTARSGVLLDHRLVVCNADAHLGTRGISRQRRLPLSPLGLQSSHEQRASTTLTWKARENLSVYADGGYERLYLLQSGYTGPATAPWQVADTEGFWDAGAGAQWLMSTRWVLKLDYMHAPSYTDTDTSVGGVAQFFPQNSTQLDSLRLDVAYKRSAALQFHFRYNYERYNSNDWALDGVGPQTVPNLLALGLQPYRYNVSAFALTASYQFGTKGATATNSQ